MNLEKPAHISDEAWREHLHWMKIMQEGQLTRDRLLLPRRPASPQQPRAGSADRRET